jgi:hypothetical protein
MRALPQLLPTILFFFMRTNRYALALSGLLLAGAGSAFGQVAPPATGTSPPPAAPAAPPTPVAPTESVPYGAGYKINFSPDGSKYLRIASWHQVWTRFNENNTGSQRLPGAPEDNTFDVGLRRSRFLVYAQLNPRFLILTHFGINNQNAVSGGLGIGDPGKKPQMFILEAQAEFKVIKQLYVGGGLTYQNGISRMTRASTTTLMTYDAPILNWPTLEKTDQFARWLGIYAKGEVGRVSYVMAMNDPFATNQTSSPATLPTNVADYNPRNTQKVFQGYLDYQFLDKESNLLPYTTGSYFGTKRVFNLGGGFLYNHNAMISRPNALPTSVPADGFTLPYQEHDLGIFSFDAFYDSPLNKEKGTALTAYAVYYNYDFGPNYVRNIGILNPSTAGGASSIPGAGTLRGNAYPVLGTGYALYAQVGYLMPKNTLGEKARLQPYAAWQHGSYDGLKRLNAKDVNVYDIGANVLLDGHNAKFTLNYRARPDYSSPQDIKYRSEVTLQTMIFL